MTTSVRLCIQQRHLQYWALLIGRLVEQVSSERLQVIKFMLMLIVYRSFFRKTSTWIATLST
jgi:hypothetical protein